MSEDALADLLRAAEAHHDAGRLPQAEALYRQILGQDPNHVHALHYLGLLAYQVGRPDAAEELIRRAISIRPDLPDPHNNLGEVLRNARRFDDAIECYGRAIALEPAYAQAYNNLGNALFETHRIDDAIESYRRATTHKPDYADAHCNFGHALTSAGLLDEAVASYRRALELRPQFPRCHSQLLLLLHYHPGYDADAIAREAEQWRARNAATLESHMRPHDNDRSPDRRLRIGYVSADFFEHTCAHFIEPLLRSHDRAQVEVFCYSNVARPDALTARLQSSCDAWRPIAHLSDEQVAGQVRADRIDVLVDLKLHTQNHRLLVFAHKPAPVQVTWLGYPGTTGLRSIDYRLTDPHLDPPGGDASVYSEQSIHLPDTFWCYDPLAADPPEVNALPARAAGHVTFGCLNNFAKVNPGVLKLWAGVMRSVEDSRLVLLAPQGAARQRVREVLKEQGVWPDRVEFVVAAPRPQYLRHYHGIDVMLDTLPYNGHTTSMDSLWMGVPVVTLVGKSSVGRAGLGQLTNLGLPELVARTPDEFVAVAKGLSEDLPRLEELRRTLRRRMEASVLMDAARFARGVEAAYRRVWDAWRARA